MKLSLNYGVDIIVLLTLKLLFQALNLVATHGIIDILPFPAKATE
jgi:hypothetical protein